MIGGFIVEGSNSKQAILRALGPTLGQAPFNVPGILVDPTLELHGGDGSLITSNDNWGSASNAAAISASGFAPAQQQGVSHPHQPEPWFLYSDRAWRK